MKLILAEIPVNGQTNFSSSINANVNAEGIISLNVSQSVSKSYPDGTTETESKNIPIKGTALEVAAKVAELGLSGLVE